MIMDKLIKKSFSFLKFIIQLKATFAVSMLYTTYYSAKPILSCNNNQNFHHYQHIEYYRDLCCCSHVSGFCTHRCYDNHLSIHYRHNLYDIHIYMCLQCFYNQHARHSHAYCLHIRQNRCMLDHHHRNHFYIYIQKNPKNQQIRSRAY